MAQSPEYDCAFYVGPLYTDASDATTFCKDYNFRNLTTLQMFVGGTWYDNQVEEFKTVTKWTDEQYNTFYD